MVKAHTGSSSQVQTDPFLSLQHFCLLLVTLGAYLVPLPKWPSLCFDRGGIFEYHLFSFGEPNTYIISSAVGIQTMTNGTTPH